MRPWLFHAGDIGVPSYWAMLMIGMSAAVYFSFREARRDGLDPNPLLDVSLVAIVLGIIGARLMHVLVEEDPLRDGQLILFHYLDHPADIFKLWNGLAFYGGLLLALPVVLWMLKRKKMPMAKVADIFGLSLLLGLGFGRIGCFLAGCCHGVPTNLPLGVTFTDPACLARPLGVPLHPTQLYSSGFAFLLFGLLWLQKRRWRRFDGQVFLSFLLLYSAGRFLIEFVRGDNRGEFFNGALSSSQLIALPLVVLSLVLLVWLARRARLIEARAEGEVDAKG